MRQEVRALKQGQLVGHLRLAAIPTALAMVSALTTPYHERHPEVRFTVRSCTSSEVLAALVHEEQRGVGKLPCASPSAPAWASRP